MTIKDLDGSLTGTPGMNVVSNDDYLHEGLDCEPSTLWNMTVCNGKFARVFLKYFLIIAKCRANLHAYILYIYSSIFTPNQRKLVPLLLRSQMICLPKMHKEE